MKIIFMRKSFCHLLYFLGTRIPTNQAPASSQNNLTSDSNHMFNSKHCVSREQLENADLNGM